MFRSAKTSPAARPATIPALLPYTLFRLVSCQVMSGQLMPARVSTPRRSLSLCSGCAVSESERGLMQLPIPPTTLCRRGTVRCLRPPPPPMRLKCSQPVFISPSDYYEVQLTNITRLASPAKHSSPQKAAWRRTNRLLDIALDRAVNSALETRVPDSLHSMSSNLRFCLMSLGTLPDST